MMSSNPLFQGDGGAKEARPTLMLGMLFVQFPWSFEELMIECLAERSAFIRAQRECVGDSGRGTGLKIPAEVGKHWVGALMSTPGSLRAKDNATLVQYLKVCVLCAFFRYFSLVLSRNCFRGARLKRL